MAAKINLQMHKIYPQALNIADNNKVRDTRYILTRSLEELGKVNPKRMHHVFIVEKCLKAVKNGDHRFFIDKIPLKVKDPERMKLGITEREYEEKYEVGLESVFSVYKRFSSRERKELELAVLAHDLGIPLGIEWEHDLNGAKIARRLIKDPIFKDSVSGLVKHHGQISNLPSSSFVRDIYELPARLHTLLFVLDFCDTASRTTFDHNHVNPIGLVALNYYLRLITPFGINVFEPSEKNFEMRFEFGFAPPVFNKTLPEEVKNEMFEQGIKLSSKCKPEALIRFYGSVFRCHFFDILLNFGLKEPQKIAKFMAELYILADQFPFKRKDVLLWPDIDMAKQDLLAKDPRSLGDAFGSYYEKNGIKNLVINAILDPSKMYFLASRLL